ncbi:MAG TPA: ATP synthase subunit I [Nevskiaceae bacterium]|nr:ATP synthase subunit I [Nevskiaceae bacterium]
MQWSAVVGLAAVAWLVGGEMAGGSAFGGGFAVALPNTVLAAWLAIRMRQSVQAGAALAMVVGEMLKLAGTVTLMVMLVRVMGKGLVWPAMLSGIIVALVAQWFALLVTRRY